MKAFSVFLVLAGILLFLSLFGFVNMTFGFIMEILFAMLFAVEGVRELIGKNFVGIGGLLFSTYMFIRAFDLFSFSSTSKSQIFMAFIASYLIGIGMQMLFRKNVKVKFWENER